MQKFIEMKPELERNGEPIGRGKGLLALSPLLVFLGIYLVSSILAKDFYKVPIASAFLIASAYALLISKKGPVESKIATFSRGAGHESVLLMLWIFILAGAFAQTAKEIGAIDATVSATLAILPPKMLLAGLFLASCFISMAIGTSVGTIVALVPIAAGIASQSSMNVGFVTAVVAGGAFFGDNLSFISDTTIAATRTQGCSMSDKFKVNVRIAAPAAVLVTLVYIFMGQNVAPIEAPSTIAWYKLIPYISVIGLAMSGINVVVVLSIGIVINALIGFADGSLSWLTWLGSIGSGIAGMGDLIIVTMLSGGMLEVIRENGGIDYIVQLLTRRINGKRGAEFSIAALVSMANVCTANNTIAILTTGRIAKDITTKFGLDPRKSASLLDTFSCMIQGVLPYGAQMLMASGLAGVSSISIIRWLFYPYALGLLAILAILFRYPKKFS